MPSDTTPTRRPRLVLVAPWVLLGAVVVLWLVQGPWPGDTAPKPTAKQASKGGKAAEPAAEASPSSFTSDSTESSPSEGDPSTESDEAASAATDADTSDTGSYASYEDQPSTPAEDYGPNSSEEMYGGQDTGEYGGSYEESYGDPAATGGTSTTDHDAPASETGDTGDEDYASTDPLDPTESAEPRAAEEVAYAFHLFDGFERGNAWAVESAADHAVLRLTSDHTTEGETALRAAFEARGNDKFELRRQAKLDLTDATAFRLDVYNPGEPLDLTLGFRAGEDTTLFTSPPQAILGGWNRDVTFPLSEVSAADTSDYAATWSWSRDRVSRLSLIVGERGQESGSVTIDNLRFDRAADAIGHVTKPVLNKITASAPRVERYDTLELTVAFDAEYQDYFDRSQVDMAAVLTAPSGKEQTVHGFVYDTEGATGEPIWKVRFTPGQIGRWRYHVTVTTEGGKAVSETYAFHCDRKEDRRGFIRIAESDPRFFEFDDGTFYYPIGQNVCWASKYEYFLDKIAAYGGNYVRVWLCPWNLQLEDPTEPGKYDLRVAKKLDALLESCAQRGIYLQLALRYHNIQGEKWSKNPYNSANGGPCYTAGEFFTLDQAKTLHKQFLDYVVARWGHSPALFAWELWNEADLAGADRDQDLIAWHREMANYLNRIDTHGHLVTTSVCTPGKLTALFELENIDFVPVHFYHPAVHTKIREAYAHYRRLRKPIFIGEFSGGHKPADDLADAKGVRIHAGLWLAFTTPLAGNAMPWWWDTYIDKNELYPHWVALTAFAKGVDRRGKDYQPLQSTAKLGEGAWAAVQGIVCPSEAILWVYDEGRIAPAEQAARPLLLEPRPLTLAGMLGGRFRVEVWDTYAGKIIAQTTATTASDGTLTFTVPPCDRDVAVKVMRDGVEGRGGRARITW